MDLNLEKRFNAEELNEIRKRVFSFADRMFLEGISVGRELNKEEIYDTTEQFVRDKLSAMTSYFVRDDLWISMPPHGYNPDPHVDIPEPIDFVDYGATIERAKKGGGLSQNPEDDEQPEGFQIPEKPDWVLKLEKKDWVMKLETKQNPDSRKN